MDLFQVTKSRTLNAAFWNSTLYPMTEPTITPEFVQKAQPHLEHACEPLLGSDDGKGIFESIFTALKNKTVAPTA